MSKQSAKVKKSLNSKKRAVSKQLAAKPGEWGAKIKKWQISGLTIDKYCKQNKINPSNFYMWKKRLALPEGPKPQENENVTKKAKAQKVAAPAKAKKTEGVMEHLEIWVHNTHKVVLPLSLPANKMQEVLRILVAV